MARGIRNQFINAFAEHPQAILAYPIQNALTRSMRDEAAKLNLTDYMSLWAGQAAYLSRDMAALINLIERLNKEVVEGLNAV